ncbi:MAG: hypothetical protein AB7G23_09610 [Vicinamibacterales bacterium]
MSIAVTATLPPFTWLPRAPGALRERGLFLRRPAVGPAPSIEDIGASLRDVARPLQQDARITVSRVSPRDCGFREVILQLDGEGVGILQHGESVTLEVRPGLHSLRAHNTLCWKTHEIVLRPGEHARFIAVNRAGWAMMGLLLVLGACPVFLTFEREHETARLADAPRPGAAD